MTPPAFHPGTWVQFRYGPATGTVVKHEQRLFSGARRIRVRWDATPRARERETIVSSLNLKEITRRTCEHCGGAALPGTTCPRSIPCPTCSAKAGQWCKRPSGHKAQELHHRRVEICELADADLLRLTP